MHVTSLLSIPKQLTIKYGVLYRAWEETSDGLSNRPRLLLPEVNPCAGLDGSSGDTADGNVANGSSEGGR